MQVTIECFKTLKDFHNIPDYRKGFNKAGVYIWGFSLEEEDFTVPHSVDKFFPYYVGKHYKDMYGRTHEHLASLGGGNLSVFDIRNCNKSDTKIGDIQINYQANSKKAKLTRGIGVPLPDTTNPLHEHLLYFPEGVHRIYDFHLNQKIKNEMDWMLKHFCIFYIEPNVDFSDEKKYKFDIDNLEKKIGQIVGYDRLITKPYKNIPKNFNVEIEHNSKIFQLEKYEDLFTFCQKI